MPTRSSSAASEAWPLIATGRVCGTSPSSAPSDTTTCTPSASARSTRWVLKARQRLEDLNRRPRDLPHVVLAEADARAVALEVVELLRVDPREAAGIECRGQERHGVGGGVSRVVPTLERAHHRRGPEAGGTTVPNQRLHPNHRTS